jgi:hypothetical protein
MEKIALNTISSVLKVSCQVLKIAGGPKGMIIGSIGEASLDIMKSIESDSTKKKDTITKDYGEVLIEYNEKMKKSQQLKEIEKNLEVLEAKIQIERDEFNFEFKSYKKELKLKKE